MRRKPLAALAAVGLLAAAASAGAEPAKDTPPVKAPTNAASVSDQKAARADALFRAGKLLRDARQYSDACPKFEESERLEPGVGVMLYLGDCYEHSGRYTQALAEFHKAAELARQRNDKREDVARARELAIESSINSTTLAEPAHRDEATGATPTPSATSTAGASHPAATPTVAVPPAQPASSTPRPEEGPASGSPADARRYVGLGLLGAGAVGIGIGAVFLDVKNQAISNGTPSDAGTASAIAFGLGGVAIVSAIALYLTAPKHKDAALVVAPAPFTAGAGAVIQGVY